MRGTDIWSVRYGTGRQPIMYQCVNKPRLGEVWQVQNQGERKTEGTAAV